MNLSPARAMLPALLALAGLMVAPANPTGAQSPADDQAARIQRVTAQNAFGLRLFGALARADADQNAFISPTSAALALSLAYNGAEGQTKTAMDAVLETQGLSLDQLNRANAALLAHLSAIDPKVTLRIANSVWVRKSGALQPKPEFLQRSRDSYGAEVGDLRGAPANVNAWVRKQTAGKIDSLIKQSDLTNAVAILANAVYFKGEWAQKFDKAATANAVFTLLDGGKRDVPMMRRNLEGAYLRGDGFQAVSVPYGAGRVRALLFMPDADTKFADFIARLTPENWSKWITRFRAASGSLGLPRFRTEYEADLAHSLKSLGMGIAFHEGKADFSGLAGRPGDVWISRAVQKSFLEVNEEGTEAAAATGIVMRTKGIRRMERFDLTFNRPFVCAIQDTTTGALLFLGQIVDPKP